MENLCKKKIRKERLLKLLMPCVAAAVGLLVAYTHAIPQIPDSLRPYVGFGVAAAAAVWFLILAVALGSKARTTFCKRVLHYGSPRELDELLVRIDGDMEAPAYRGGGTCVGNEWIVGGYYFPKVLSFDKLSAVFLIRVSNGKRVEYRIRMLDDDQKVVSILVGMEKPARAIYDILLLKCPWALHGAQDDYNDLIILPQEEQDALFREIQAKRYQALYMDANARQYAHANVTRMRDGVKSGKRRGWIFPFSRGLAEAFGQSLAPKRRTFISMLIFCLNMLVFSLLCGGTAYGLYGAAADAIQTRDLARGLFAALLFVLFYLSLHVVLGLAYCTFIRKEGSMGIFAENEELEGLFFIEGGESPTRDELWALGFAAPMRAKNGEECNRVDYIGEFTKEEELEALERDWGIATPDSLRDTIEALYAGMHAPDFDALLPALSFYTPKERADCLTEGAGLDGASAGRLCGLMDTIQEEFSLYGLAIPRKTVFAWDLARAAYLALSGYRLGLLPREEALTCMRKAGELAGRCYGSWNQYASAYLYGRKLWLFFGMEEGDDPGMLADDTCSKRVSVLLNSPKSYYKEVGFASRSGEMDGRELAGCYAMPQ